MTEESMEKKSLLGVCEKFMALLSVLFVLLSSGGNWKVNHIYYVAGVVGIFFILKRKLVWENVIRAVIFGGYVLFNSICVAKAPASKKDIAVIAIRVAVCVMLASNMDSERFKKIFFNIMAGLSVLSLACFGCMLVFGKIPFMQQYDAFYGTFFHTYGFLLTAPKRNCGIFSEPGIFQIYLNIAILMLSFDKAMPRKKHYILLALYSITLLTTGSLTGYICFAINFCIYICNNEFHASKVFSLRNRKIFFIVLAVALAVVEHFTGFIMHFITHWNSYASRHDDTLTSLVIIRDYPFFGIGMANDNTAIWDMYTEQLGAYRMYGGNLKDLASSNGLLNCGFSAGIPFTVYFVYRIIRNFLVNLDVRGLFNSVLIGLLFLGFFIAEPIMLTPAFIICMFTFSDKKKLSLKKVFAIDEFLPKKESKVATNG